MNITKQSDGLFTVEASFGMMLEHKVTHIRTKLAVDQTEQQVNNWKEVSK